MKHIIRKQIIYLGIDRRLDAFGVQHDMSVFYWHHLIPLLEKVFNELCKDDETIILDSLEIELGEIVDKEMKHQWEIDKLLRKIEGQLNEKIKFKNGSDTITSRQPRSLTAFMQWLFYMENGYLPWNAMQPDNDWHKKVLESAATEYKNTEKLKKLLQRNSSVAKRIIFQHDIIFLTHLVESITARNQQKLPEYIEAVYKLIILNKKIKTNIAGIGKREFELATWKKILLFISVSKIELTTETIITAVLRSFPENADVIRMLKSAKLKKENPVMHTLLKAALAESGDAMNGADLTQEKISPAEKPGIKIKRPEDFIAQTAADKNNTSEEIESTSAIPANENKKIKYPDAGEISDNKKVVADGVFIKNAGLVLLAPFINPFFKNIQLVEAAKFTSDLHQQRALYVLHYLATGNNHAEEHELVAAKILCGYPIQQPVDGEIELSAAELNEADEMLKDVIAQWEILKNTSVAGLREGFLQREGKLFSENDHLCLLMETNSIDVLLDFLPWNFSMIKLPWMKERLTVEWK